MEYPIFKCCRCEFNSEWRTDFIVTGNSLICRKCHKIKQDKWRKENREKCREYSKKHRFKSVYGITSEQYSELLKLQNNVCAICKRTCKHGDDLGVDHDHNTGMIRGLLCHNCNIGIGMLEENEDFIWNMLEYLKKYKWNKVA